MNRLKLALCLLAATVIISGAGFGLLHAGTFRRGPVTFDPPYPETNAAGDPILAAFAGRIPCTVSDCPMMKLALVLYQDRETKASTTYWLGYIGVGNGNNDRTVRQGKWSVRKGVKGYPEATVYELDLSAEPDLRLYWQVNEDILLPLDENLTPKVGTSAWGYMLSRDAKPYGPRTYE